MVEAAIVMPLLLLLIAMVTDLGRAYFVSIMVIDAAREGARYGVTSQNATEMCARAMAAATPPSGITLNCSADHGYGSGTPVKVTVSCNFPLIMGGLLGRSAIPISYTAAFRIR
jgi:Flp pilus assembly protein TadG